MIDIALLFGKLLFLVLLYLFLFAAIRSGLGSMMSVSPKKQVGPLALVVAAGPPELVGIRVPLTERVTIGRAAGSDIVIADDFVSSRHAAIDPSPRGPVLEDLESTNGTIVNGKTVGYPVPLRGGDLVEIGRVKLRVERL
ncbi:MAG TPA: FHA domain-containing protein [Coriobacteriia bacterium]|jgi:pSer/pThr/pTyr-binding forkhead associated (FHA) protein